MLEADGILRTWAVDEEPAIGHTLTALALPDHRQAYLDYEGPVSGELGEVRRWDEGTYRLVDEFASEAFVVEIRGRRLSGQVHFERTTTDAQRWVVSLCAS